MTRSTYHCRTKRFAKSDKYANVKFGIPQLFKDENNGRYGYRWITLELRKTRTINHEIIQRLMNEMGLFCIPGEEISFTQRPMQAELHRIS